MHRGFFRFFYLIILVSFAMLHSREAKAQDDGSRLRISLLTVEPGEELYSTFGHSAIRVIDSNSVSDIIFNYGTFDFDTPGFYTKFIRGKLMYYVSTEYYSDFIAANEAENRGTTEQVLDLAPVERQVLREALYINVQEKNKFYLYDFFLDNCTTRLRDLIEKYKIPKPVLPPVMPVATTFRQAIHQYLDINKKYWSKLGIDILLGAPTDAVMTARQQEFLPDNLMKALDSTKNTNLVSAKKKVSITSKTDTKIQFFTPLVCSSILLSFFVLLSLLVKRIDSLQNFIRVLDGLLFFITGALGCLLIFMMFGTDHIMTKQNYNIIWALPTHILFCFFVFSKANWVKKYFLFTSVLMIGLLIAWAFLPQQLNTALIPVVILLIFRSYILSSR